MEEGRRGGERPALQCRGCMTQGREMCAAGCARALGHAPCHPPCLAHAHKLPKSCLHAFRLQCKQTLYVTVKATFDDFAVANAGAPVALWTEIK